MYLVRYRYGFDVYFKSFVRAKDDHMLKIMLDNFCNFFSVKPSLPVCNKWNYKADMK